MKNTFRIILLLVVLLGVAACSSSDDKDSINTATEYVDSYTSASTTKTLLTGSDLNDAKTLLASIGSDLVSKAETEAPGYVASEISVRGHIMSVNPDGSVGVSTISDWNFADSGGQGTATVILTYGQAVLNLEAIGSRGSLLVMSEGAGYFLHLKVTDVAVKEYSDEAFDAGEFRPAYSGQANKLSSYTITFEVLSIEKTYALMF